MTGQKDESIVLRVSHLKKYFPVQKGIFKRVVGHVKAVDDVSFFIRRGETVGLVGESGSGKTTLGRCIIRLQEPTEGSMAFRDSQGRLIDLSRLSKKELKPYRRELQMIFQDPYSSLNPRMSIGDIIGEPLAIHKIGTSDERREMVKQLLNKVGLNETHINRFPNEFSGGQRQRIGVARSLSLHPKLIVCDEPVSALDVSIQAQVLNLLSDLQKELGLTYLFITHDLSVVDYISDRIMVMYLGKIVEITRSDQIYLRPRHPYTEALLSVIPDIDRDTNREKIILEGNIPSPANPPLGCRFHTRCIYATDRCRTEDPPLRPVNGHPESTVACHRSDELKLAGYQSKIRQR